LRAINEVAGVDLALVNYHFGSRTICARARRVALHQRAAACIAQGTVAIDLSGLHVPHRRHGAGDVGNRPL
jgi:hypothetical protein